MKYKIVTLCLLLLCSAIAFSQNFSNKGTDFWITYPVHIDGLSSIMGIYITSDVNASGTVVVNGQSISFTVTANTVTEKFIGSTSAADASNSYVYLSQSDVIKTGAAIHVVSDNPVVVYAHIIHSARSGATLVLPSSVWGREYVVPSYKSIGTATGEGYGTITIVAADTNTTVQITPIIASSNGARVAGVAYPITLVNPGDVYQIEFKQGEDISGTLVQSISNGSGCKKIAVFSSTTWSAFGCNSASSGDNLFQQLFPTGAWGKSFLTAPAKTRTSDIFRVFVSDPSAIVTKTENGITSTLTGLVSNSYYEYATGNPTFIQSDKTASVVQYFTTMACQNGALIGDPEMIDINPIEQTINNITVFSAHQNVINARFPGQSNVNNCYLNIIIKTSAEASFKINNASPNASFIPIQGTPYSYLQEDVTARSMTNPVQNLKADSNFIAIAYGFGNVESYGYNAGTNVIDLTQGIVIQNPYATTISQASCTGMPVSFAVKFSYQPSSITWDFGNNANLTPNAIVSFNNPTADSSFIDANSGKTIYVYKLPAKYNFSATGSYPVKVTANNPTSDGCSGIQVITYTVQVYSPPVTNFNLVTSGCATDSVHFTDLTNPVTGSITKWTWDFNDQTTDSVQNPVKKYAVAGNYNIHLRTVTDIGCFGDTTKSVALSALPDIKFGVKDTTCVDGLVTFNDYSTIVSGMGTINAWIWSYGDGTRDTAYSNASRTHIYNQVGRDTVYLNLVTNTGCSEVTADYIDIHPHPVPGFILPEVCLADAAAQFADTSSIPDGSQSQFTYAWNLNAGSPSVLPGPAPPTSTLKNPSIKYKLADNYEVALKVTSKDGCAAFLQKTFTVNGSTPNANFTVLQPAVLCSNDSVRISDMSTVDFGSITQVEIYWDSSLTQKEVDSFPTSGTMPGTGKTYSHLYPNLQQTPILKHYIRFVAYSGISCVSTKLDSVTVHQSPLVQFITLPGICNDTTALLLTEATETRGVPGSILFTGAGVSATGIYTPQSVLPGTYPIKYLYTSSMGCRDSATQPITVWPSPIAKWGISSPDCERNAITFTDASLANYSNITNWYWNFGDGATLLHSAVPFTKTYIAANTYTASLRVMTDSGCRSAYNTQIIQVNYLPVVNFVLPTAICLPDGKGTFLDASTIGDNSQSNFSYLWNFGDANDPSASTLQNPVHQYTALGPYTVQLKVTSKDGCLDSLSQLLAQVYPQPKAGFSAVPTTACVNDMIAFTDQSNGITSSATRWVWDLAEGYSSSTQNPSRQFRDSGTFTISLSIYNGQGCVSDTVLKEVTVYPYPKLLLGPGRVVLQGGMISIIPQYLYGTNLQYLWTPSTYLNSDTAARPQASPPEDIQYKLAVTGIGNCTVYDSVTITVLKTPMIPNAFSPNGDGINDTWSIRYLNSYPGCTVDVFDRYGQVVFRSIGYSTDWDGRYKGVPIPIGTYYYIINPKNGRPIMSGSVTIIR